MKGKETRKRVWLHLNERHARKLESLAILSRRKETDVLRLLIEDATIEQLGVRENESKEPA